MSKPASSKRRATPPPEPIDVVEGIPDRAPASPRWKFVMILLIFLGWVGFLLMVQIVGRPSL